MVALRNRRLHGKENHTEYDISSVHIAHVLFLDALQERKNRILRCREIVAISAIFAHFLQM
jgi:hypothetical protein